MGGVHSMHRREMKHTQSFRWENKVHDQLEDLRWVHNIKLDFTKQDVQWIHLAQDRDM
jgi:hypothetical protein